MMEDKKPVESTTPSISVLMDVRTRLRRTADRGLTAEATFIDLQSRILNTLLILGSMLVIFPFLAYLPVLMDQKEWTTIAILALAAVGLIAVTILRRIPLLIRAGIFLILFYGVGIYALLDQGLFGSGLLILIFVPIMALILIGLRSRGLVLTITIGSLIVIAILMVSGTITAPGLAPGAGNASPVSWTLASVVFIAIVLIGTFSLSTYLRGQEINLQKQQYLAEDLERERQALENRVYARTQELNRRLGHIRTAADIARTISMELDIDRLLPNVCELIKKGFDLYYVGLFLVQERSNSGEDLTARQDRGEGSYAVLVAGTGEAGRSLLASGHRLLVGGDSMIGWATAFRQARIALDVGIEAVRFDNPHLPKTRSELALPILAQERTLGALSIQSDKAEAFDENDIIVLQNIADSLGSAIVNARLLNNLKDSLNEIQTLHRHYLQQSWAEVVERKGDITYTYKAPLSGERTGSERMLEVPIKLRDQEIGSMYLESEGLGSSDGNWSPEEMALIDTIADQVAIALENARLLEETQSQAEQERISAGIASKVWASTSVEVILRTAIEELGTSLGAAEGYIQLKVEES